MTMSNSQFDLGHWVLRLIAYIIDSIIIAIPTVILVFFVFLTTALTGPFGFFNASVWLIFPFVLGILSILYFIVLDVSWGGTFGKRILGLRVQMQNGSKVTFDKALIRNISKIHPLLLLLDWLVGVVTAGDKRQKFTDTIAGTTIVQVNQGNPK